MATTAKCKICGFPTAERLVIRDMETNMSYGWISLDATPEEREQFDQRFYGMVDRGMQLHSQAECKPCGIQIAQEIEAELRWMAEQRGDYEQ